MTRPLNRRTLMASIMSLSTALALSSHAARAQLVTFDPTNYAQNLLVAAHTLQQVNQEITSLQNQALSLVNEARNLASLPISVLTQLQQTVARTQQLVAQAQHIAYNVTQIDQAFQSIYGKMSLSATDQALVTGAQTRWQNTVGALQDAMRTQATVVSNISDHQNQMTALVSASQTASGALAATQAGNQLLALQAQQLSDLTTLIAANGRAQALKDAEAATAAAQGQEQRRRFMTPSTYQPGNAQMFYGD